MKRLEGLAEEIDQAAKRLQKRNIVTFHNVFHYLAQTLKVCTIVGEIEVTPGQEPSAGDISELIETIKTKTGGGRVRGTARLATAGRMVANEVGVPVRSLDTGRHRLHPP